MIETHDIRWKQRFSNFRKALAQLELFVKKKKLSKLEEQGLIQSFEYTYELAWNTIKDFYEAQGEEDIQGSRDAFRLAFRRGLVGEGQVWMDMIKSRIQTTHSYDEKIANEVVSEVLKKHFKAFKKLSSALAKRE